MCSFLYSQASWVWCMTQTLLFTCDDQVKLGCSVIWLIEDMQEHAHNSLAQHNVLEKWTQSGYFVIRPWVDPEIWHPDWFISVGFLHHSWKVLELYFLKFNHSSPLTHPFWFVSYNRPTIWTYITHTLGRSAFKSRITAVSQLVMFWL
jgi:hypothetical protein